MKIKNAVVLVTGANRGIGLAFTRERDAPLNGVDMATFYTPGPKGYTDHPALAGGAT
jgi:hypothetical protein